MTLHVRIDECKEMIRSIQTAERRQVHAQVTIVWSAFSIFITSIVQIENAQHTTFYFFALLNPFGLWQAQPKMLCSLSHSNHFLVQAIPNSQFRCEKHTFNISQQICEKRLVVFPYHMEYHFNRWLADIKIDCFPISYERLIIAVVFVVSVYEQSKDFNITLVMIK